MVTLEIEADQSQDAAADSLECDSCSSEIRHDEWMYQLRPGFNLHGDYIQAGGLNRRRTICKRCTLDFLDEDTDAVEVGGSVRDATASGPSKRRSVESAAAEPDDAASASDTMSPAARIRNLPVAGCDAAVTSYYWEKCNDREALYATSDIVDRIHRLKEENQLPGWVKRLLIELAAEFEAGDVSER